MRPFTSTITLDEARRRLDANVRPIARIERIPLHDAGGRVAAADVQSALDVPPFARSAMDGYAVIAQNLESATKDAPVSLRVLDRIYTGQLPTVTVHPGACAEIATGAPLPAGADAVVMVEETMKAGGDDIAFHATAATGQHVVRRGADITPGDLVVRAGELLTPSKVGALAAIGRDQVDVYAKPRVAILSTGNEVIDPGQALAPGQIYDVNRFTLGAVVSSHGGIAEPHRPAQDTIEALVAALDRSMGADLVVFSGGSSVGERDLIVDAIAARGEMIFHGIAVRPGKPTAFARIGDTLFFGMPGNPTSCLSNAYILLVPFLRAMARLPLLVPRTVRVPLGRRIASAVNRHQFYTVRVRDGSAYPAFKGSGDITSLSQADGYIEIPANTAAIDEGSIVEVTLF